MPERGRAALDLIALRLVLRKSAKVLARVPLLATCADATVLQRYGEQGLAAELLPRVGRGELILTVGANGRAGHDPAELAATARLDTDEGERRNRGCREDGSGAGPLRVPGQGAVGALWAQAADCIAVPAHTGDSLTGDAHTGDGRAVLAPIPRDHAGVTIAEQVSTSGELFGEVRLDAVRIEPCGLIKAEGAWEWPHGLLVTGTCALALGLGKTVPTRTSQYTGKRKRFGLPGDLPVRRRAGSGPVHRSAGHGSDPLAGSLADHHRRERLTATGGRRLTATGGSDSLPPEGGGSLPPEGEGSLPPAVDIAVAKIRASGGVRRVVRTAQHLHGGFGADTDYPLHRFHAWAKQVEPSLGPAAAHEEALGDLLAAHPLG